MNEQNNTDKKGIDKKKRMDKHTNKIHLQKRCMSCSPRQTYYEYFYVPINCASCLVNSKWAPNRQKFLALDLGFINSYLIKYIYISVFFLINYFLHVPPSCCSCSQHLHRTVGVTCEALLTAIDAVLVTHDSWYLSYF